MLRRGDYPRMNRELICNWLGLAEKGWPPDPYALLGVTPAECDAPKLELRVQDRMKKLRCYQLSHPEEATEGMNRVAQAFISLVERHGTSAVAAPPPPCPSSEAASGLPTFVPPTPPAGGQADWAAAPPPVRAAKKAPLPCIPVEMPAPAKPEANQEPLPSPVESEEQVIRHVAEESSEASSGLQTLASVCQRVQSTRRLLIAWRRAGRYLGNPKRKLARSAEKRDFENKLVELVEAAESFPAFVAHPGLPGYRALALAHLTMTPEMFNAMGEEPRDLLARDWTQAHKVLLVHRAFLLRRFKSLRRRGLVGRLESRLSEYRLLLWILVGVAVGMSALALLVILFWS